MQDVQSFKITRLKNAHKINNTEKIFYTIEFFL